MCTQTQPKTDRDIKLHTNTEGGGFYVSVFPPHTTAVAGKGPVSCVGGTEV